MQKYNFREHSEITFHDWISKENEDKLDKLRICLDFEKAFDTLLIFRNRICLKCKVTLKLILILLSFNLLYENIQHSFFISTSGPPLI